MCFLGYSRSFVRTPSARRKNPSTTATHRHANFAVYSGARVVPHTGFFGADVKYEGGVGSRAPSSPLPPRKTN